MPYKYIGRTTDFRGKTLWEIVGNLKNFGVGRIVVRSRMERYPEPSFMKIVKVEPLANPENPSMDNVRKVRVFVERTFRGVKQPEVIPIEGASYKTDYRLLPKDEEDRYCNRNKSYTYEKILPRYMDFPPLMRELIIREAGGSYEEEPKLEIVYNKTSTETRYRIANENEQPTIQIDSGLGKPTAPSLYEGVLEIKQ